MRSLTLNEVYVVSGGKKPPSGPPSGGGGSGGGTTISGEGKDCVETKGYEVCVTVKKL